MNSNDFHLPTRRLGFLFGTGLLALAAAAPAQIMPVGTMTRVAKQALWQRHFGNNTNDWREVSLDLLGRATGSIDTGVITGGAAPPALPLRRAIVEGRGQAIVTVLGHDAVVGRIVLSAESRNGWMARTTTGPILAGGYSVGIVRQGRCRVQVLDRYVYDGTRSTSGTLESNLDLTAFSVRVPFPLGPVPMSLRAEVGVDLTTRATMMMNASSTSVHAGVLGTARVAPYGSLDAGIDVWLAAAGVGGRARFAALTGSFDIGANNNGVSGSMGLTFTPFSISSYVWAEVLGNRWEWNLWGYSTAGQDWFQRPLL